jgi:Amt family ammonium transporter
VNPAGADGLSTGNPKQLLIQAAAVADTVVYSLVLTFVIYKIVDVICGARVTEKEEAIGLDLTQHHERAYTMIE